MVLKVMVINELKSKSHPTPISNERVGKNKKKHVESNGEMKK